MFFVFWKSCSCHFLSSFNDRLNYCNLDVIGGKNYQERRAAINAPVLVLIEIAFQISYLSWQNFMAVTLVNYCFKRSSPTQSLSAVFSYFFPAWQFSHLYSVQSVKIFCTANTACDVTVILSRFLFSSEVVSHIAFGDVSRLHSWVYCLVSSEREKKCQRATTLRLRPIFPRLHMWESCHVHSSTASWTLWKELMLWKKKMFRHFIVIIENAYKHQQQNITHIFLSSGPG